MRGIRPLRRARGRRSHRLIAPEVSALRSVQFAESFPVASAVEALDFVTDTCPARLTVPLTDTAAA